MSVKARKNVMYKGLPEPFGSAVDAYFEKRQEDPAGTRWSWTSIRLDDLLELVWDHMTLAEAVPAGMTFADYHANYIEEARRTEGWPPDWAVRRPDSIWPIILEGPPSEPFGGTGIEDGWYRFHWYIDRWPRSKRIPVAWRME